MSDNLFDSVTRQMNSAIGNPEILSYIPDDLTNIKNQESLNSELVKQIKIQLEGKSQFAISKFYLTLSLFLNNIDVNNSDKKFSYRCDGISISFNFNNQLKI
jgi:hypothetical protein